MQLSAVNYRNYVIQQIPRTYSSYVTEILCLLKNKSSFLPPLSPQQPPFYSVSMSLITLDTSYNWNHAVFVILWLAYFT